MALYYRLSFHSTIGDTFEENMFLKKCHEMGLEETIILDRFVCVDGVPDPDDPNFVQVLKSIIANQPGFVGHASFDLLETDIHPVEYKIIPFKPGVFS